MSFAREMEVAARLARSAGQVILAQREDGDLEVGSKARGEVVTSADRAADRLIHEGLAARHRTSRGSRPTTGAVRGCPVPEH